MFYENKLEKANKKISESEFQINSDKWKISQLSQSLELHKSIIEDYKKGIPVDTTFDAICKALENHDKYY